MAMVVSDYRRAARTETSSQGPPLENSNSLSLASSSSILIVISLVIIEENRINTYMEWIIYIFSHLLNQHLNHH